MAAIRLWFVLMVAGLVGASGQLAENAVAADLITQPRAEAHGLTAAWFNMAGVDSGMGRLEYIVLDRGTIFALSTLSVVSAIDAETGKTLWTTRVGDSRLVSTKPTTGIHLVAITNGSTIYILNRHTGQILWKHTVDGALGAGPAISPSRVYVSLVGGKMEAYAFDWETPQMREYAWKTVAEAPGAAGAQAAPAADPKGPAAGPAPADQGGPGAAPVAAAAQPADVTASVPTEAQVSGASLRLLQKQDRGLFLQSFGRIDVEPRITFSDRGSERVAWLTDRGFMFVGEISLHTADRFSLVYQLRATADIVAPPCVRFGDHAKGIRGRLWAAAADGYIFCLNEPDGKLLWRLSTGSLVEESPVLIEDSLYVATRFAGMYRLNADTGETIWHVQGPTKFIAASAKRIYVRNELGQMLYLDKDSGARLGQLDIAGFHFQITNRETDRIYLADKTGLVQCLHETQLGEPLYHVPVVTEEAKPEGQKSAPKSKEPVAPPPPAPPAQDADNPFR